MVFSPKLTAYKIGLAKPQKEFFREPVYKSPMFLAMEKSFSKFKHIKNIVFVLSGGGLKGISYIPVLDFMSKMSFYPNFSVGTSAGALAGIPYMLKQDLNEAFSILKIEKKFSKLFNNLSSLMLIAKNSWRGFFSEHFLKDFSLLLEKKNIKYSNHLKGFFGVFCIDGFRETGIFGSFGDFSASPNLDVSKMLYSSIASPPVFSPLLFNKKSVSVFSSDFSSLKIKYYDKFYAYDGAASQVIPLDVAVFLSRKLLSGKTLFVIFNSSWNKEQFEELSNVISVIDGFSRFLIADQSFRVLEKYFLKIPIIMFNFNYDGKLLTSFSGLNNISLIYERGKEFISVVEEHLIKHFKGK